ncbi:restriction endonuclease subunit S [Nioella sp. MMSF_3534]|uniref:restriction endonuclease subunit S n=1 Tax=Nioella sp. MMSF_3534 TaxID=3046720 RepID=UPI00273F6615|nr:restriction endonuclease subunit S [Nioella sp. MMSF_3534]
MHVPIEEIAEVNPRKNVELSGDDLVSFVPMAAVDEVSGTIAAPIDRPYHEVSRGFTHFRDEDVILAKITPSMENGKSAVAGNLTNGTGLGSTEFHVLRTNGTIKPRYLWYYIRQKTFRVSAQTVMSGAVGQQRVPADWLKNHRIPIPPLAEQQRIVGKVDRLTERTARACEDLDRIPSLIARYKSAILSMAFNGDLTKDYRKKNDTLKGNGIDSPPDWVIKPLGEISDIQGGIQVGKKRPSDAVLVEVPYLRVANVQRGWLDLDEIKTIRVTPQERDRLLLQEGDILMNEGGDRDKLGRGWVWHEEVRNCIHQNHVFRIRLNDEAFPPEFISHYANENGQQYFIDQGKQTTNLASISKRKVSALPIPVPPIDEAVEIVRRIEVTFAWLDRVATEHAAAKRLVPKLNAAILEKAFRGELVPQDPNDEPASDLLERTKAELAAARKEKQARKTRLSTTAGEIKMNAKNLQEALSEAGDWISAQDAFQRCGIGPSASTEEVEALYAELRRLDKDGKLETEAVNDEQGRKLHDRLRLKAA